MNPRFQLWIASLINSVPPAFYWVIAMIVGGFNPGVMGWIFLAGFVLAFIYLGIVSRPTK